MLAWEDVSWPNRILVFALLAFALYLFVFAPEDFQYTWLFAPLFLATFIYHLVDSATARRRSAVQRAHAQARQPALGAAPLKVSSRELPFGMEFGVFDLDSGESLGRLSREQLSRLIAIHEGWGLDTNDFFIMPETIQVISEELGEPGIAAFLDQGLAGRDSMEVRWAVDKSA